MRVSVDGQRLDAKAGRGWLIYLDARLHAKLPGLYRDSITYAAGVAHNVASGEMI